MALSPPAARELMHSRDITVRGYFRTDGLIDVDARLVDTKPYAFDGSDGDDIPAGTPLHEMWVRMTIDEHLVIVACEAETMHGPYAGCRAGPDNMGALVGLALKAGFIKAANERLRGAAGCTHIREMLQQIATVAHQTLWPVKARLRKEAPDQDAARMLNTCIAYASDGAVVRDRWPQHYTGPKPAAAPQLSAAAPSR